MQPGAPHNAQMHTQATMLPTAFQAHEYAIGYRGPLGVFGAAINADLCIPDEVCRIVLCKAWMNDTPNIVFRLGLKASQNPESFS